MLIFANFDENLDKSGDLHSYVLKFIRDLKKGESMKSSPFWYDKNSLLVLQIYSGTVTR